MTTKSSAAGSNGALRRTLLPTSSDPIVEIAITQRNATTASVRGFHTTRRELEWVAMAHVLNNAKPMSRRFPPRGSTALAKYIHAPATAHLDAQGWREGSP